MYLDVRRKMWFETKCLCSILLIQNQLLTHHASAAAEHGTTARFVHAKSGLYWSPLLDREAAGTHLFAAFVTFVLLGSVQGVNRFKMHWWKHFKITIGNCKPWFVKAVGLLGIPSRQFQQPLSKDLYVQMRIFRFTSLEIVINLYRLLEGVFLRC